MKKGTILAVLLIQVISSLALAQGISPKDPRWKQLNQSYGFVRGQQASLELIEGKYPDLARKVMESSFAFNTSALGESFGGVERELSDELGDKWPAMKQMMESQIQELIEGQQFTKDQAADFLGIVKRRAKGELTDTIRSVLLSANLRYKSNPGLELIEGWKQTYRTKGHAKSKGLDFSVSFPLSWSKREGNRPNIVQFFQSGAGHGPIMCNLMVTAVTTPAGYRPTQEDLEELFNTTELKDMVSDDGVFVYAKSIVLEGSPAGILVSDQTMQRMDFSRTIRMTQFITFHNNALISIQFMLGNEQNPTESLAERQQKYLPTFLTIANTFVLNDRY